MTLNTQHCLERRVSLGFFLEKGIACIGFFRVALRALLRD